MEAKKARSSAKSVVTKKIKEISGLMTDEENVDEVMRKSTELEEAFKKFQEAHEAFHCRVETPAAIEKSGNYYASVLNQVEQLQVNVDIWLAGIEASKLTRSLEIHPEDSVSNVGSRSLVSRSSHASRSSRNSSASAKARAAAKRAILKAEAATIKMIHEIEEEELKLRQRKDKLKLETQLAKAEAEELAYAESKIDRNSLHEDEGEKKSIAVELPELIPREEQSSSGHPPPIKANVDVSGQSEHLREESITDRDSQQRRTLSTMAETPLPGQRPPLHANASGWQTEIPQYSFGAAANSTPQGPQVSPSRSDVQLLLQQQQEAILALTLPQPDVPVFTGDPVEYCDFIRAFENLIERKTSSPSSRLYYLLQYTSGQVQDLVRSCLAMPEDRGYKEAKRQLTERYGQPYKIATAYVDRVINGQPIRAEDGSALQRFSILLTSCSNTLKEIGYLNRLENPDCLRKIVDRLPYSLKLKWRDLVDSITQREARDPNLKDLTDFVEVRSRVTNHPIFGKVQVEQKSSNSKFNDRRKKDGKTFTADGQQKPPNSNQPPNKTDERKQPKCPSCSRNHWLSQCNDFKKLRLSDRYKFVRAKGLCINCLVSGHFVQDCPKPSFCRIQGCKKKHSTFLHEVERSQEVTPSQPSGSNGATDAESVPTQGSNGYVQSETFRTSSGSSIIGLSIVPVKVKAKGQDKKVLTYAFLDSGSNTSFCTEDLLKKLGVKGEKTTLSLTTMQTSNEEIACSLVNLEVSDLSDLNSIDLPMVYSRPSLPVSTDTIGTQEDVNRWPHLKGVTIPSIDAEIGLLLGSDVPEVLQPKEMKQSKNGGPFATRTILGWVLNGPLGRTGVKRPAANFVDTNAKLSKQFEDYCNLEFNDSSYEPKTSMSQNDRRALEIIENSAKLVDGHYEIGLPWKNNPPPLESNKVQAESRLQPLKRRLQKDPSLHTKYKDFMDDLLRKNYAEKVNSSDLALKDTWYLPHHPVFHPQKPEKVRVVFDCSAKYRGTSLNDQLLQGPDLTNTLVGVLTRFREEPVAFMSDIEAMFYQVRVQPNDRDYLRFLWWPDGDLDKEPEEYKMCVHLFGGASSPSCANYALKKTAEDNNQEFDAMTVETVKRNFYVDDCLRSVTEEVKAVRLVGQLRELLSKGGFRLTKWISNSKKVLNSVPESERAPSVKDLNFDQNAVLTERALGVQWNVNADTFGFKISHREKPATRRGILSIICSVYDPLGFVSPCILLAKAIQQELCLKGLGWDDQIPESTRQRWNTWLSDLPKLERFEIPRCFKPSDFASVQCRELHHFSDASSQGYGAVSYLRQIDTTGNVHCSLVMAKSRLAPLKSVTIPRMELSAAVLATRLDRMIKQETTTPIDRSVFWTDSTCVLRYIENKDKRFQTFVANRISAILEQSNANQWRYVDTSLNPADEASRGMTADALLNNQRWVQGPDFLSEPEETWPQRPADFGEISSNDPEVKKTPVTFANKASKPNGDLNEVLQRFSSWTRLKKVVAWILRYKNMLRKQVQRRKANQVINYPSNAETVTPLSVSEMKDAENEIIRYVQKQSFAEEVQILSQTTKETQERKCNSAIKKCSSLYKLDPIIEDNLVRVGGRLHNAPIENDAKHPAILPKKHHVVNLIVNYYHRASGHSGIEYTLSLIRQRFWILGARSVVRNIVNTCFDCRRLQAPVMQQKMASLPEDRLTPSKPPFTYVGIDCFGPFEVRRGRTTAKRYGVLFTCLAIRAVHIEVVHSLDTESFINALRRFISRRGRPEEIRSDNGGNFVKGERELREALSDWNQAQIHEYLLQLDIKWTFNPPAASHHGGVWERCIRTVRKVMKVLLKEQVLDDEGLNTLMCEVESIVNGRPITKVSDDAKDFNALTPNHLLLLRAGTATPPGMFSKEDNYTCRRWRQVQYLSDIFWSRWIKEYLPSLQQRQKWNKPQRNLVVNDIVLLLDEKTPRSSWPLGRVLEVYSNRKDGLVRSAKVKTRMSELVRPVDKIVLLEAAEMTSKD